MARPKSRGKSAAKPAAGGGGKKASSASNGKQQKKRNGGAGKEKSIAKDVYSDEEDDEQEERMNAKMDIDGVYEYEQPETFENDSEIDEDEAFNSEDEQSYGSFFASKDKKKATQQQQQKKKKQSADSDNDEDDDAATFDDEEEEDEEDDEAAGGDLLSDMLGTAPAKRLSTKNDDDDDEDSALENSDDDAEPKNLSSLADGLVPERKKKKLTEISTDGVRLSAAIAGGDGELTLDSLLGGGGGGSGDGDASTATGDEKGLNLSKVKKQVRDLETNGSGALQAAVAPVHEERATRKIAYTEKKKDVDLFQTVVRRNRQKETMDFREQIPKMENLTAASLTSKFSAQTSMEKDVEALLKAGDLSDRTIAKDEQEELAQKKVSKEEVIARQQELAKMRALMFYEEQKQKRIKKIKSKLYHKIRNSQDKKQAEKQHKQLRELDPELADQLENEMAEKRAEERMTLKHTNTSKWVKHQLKRGIQADNETRGAIADQLRRGEELRRKMHTVDSEDDDDLDDDSGDENDGVDAVTRLQKRLEKQAGALVMEIDDDEANASQTKGLHGMKFMQRAVQKQREKARTETEKLLRELKGGDDGLLSDGDELSSGDEGKNEAKKAQSQDAKKSNTKKKKNVKATAEDKEAVAKALPKGALQTGNVSMDKGLSARASGAIAVDLGDGTSSKALGLEAGTEAAAKTIELGGSAKDSKTKKTAAAAEEPVQAEERNETEENPWLTGAATNTKSKKRNKKAATKKEQTGADVASAIESLSKSVTKDAAATAAANSLSVLTGGAKNNKKRKLDQTTSGTSTSTDDAKDTSKKSKQAAGADAKTTDGKLTQEELVRRAFAFADEDEDEIAREKELIASQDTTAKKGAEIAKLVGMTGWGSWAGDGVKVSFRQKAREEQAKKLAADTKKKVLASRKDAKMARVLINEKKDKRAAKFAVQDVPYPFTSREEYEMAMRNPLGSDWNTPASTSALTVPKVMKRAGVMINPLALTKADKKEATKELTKQHKKDAKRELTKQRKAKF